MEHVDLYCERLGPGVLAEPVNALTNAMFLVIAVLLWQMAQRLGKLMLATRILIYMLALIGIGSALFHTLATPATRIMDVVPILVFMTTYLGVYARKIVGLRILSVAFLMVSFILSALFARQFSWLLNGVLTYVPALFLIMSLGLVHYMTHQKDRFELLLAGEVFVVALFFRTIDEAVCSTFDLGTHFLWHLFSGLAIYIAMRALFRNLKEGRSSVGQPTGRLFKVINVALGKPGP